MDSFCLKMFPSSYWTEMPVLATPWSHLRIVILGPWRPLMPWNGQHFGECAVKILTLDFFWAAKTATQKITCMLHQVTGTSSNRDSWIIPFLTCHLLLLTACSWEPLMEELARWLEEWSHLRHYLSFSAWTLLLLRHFLGTQSCHAG